MTDLAQIQGLLNPHYLAVSGGFSADQGSHLPAGCKTLLLLGPQEPGFWGHLKSQPEWLDGAPDPMDRWSQRAISAVADELHAAPLFPFGGPPWHPFQKWALQSGRAWESPVRLLVHDRMGLFASYRGALALPFLVDLPTPRTTSPCVNCADQPCLTACPVSALTRQGYDLPSCHNHLDRAGAQTCMKKGCAVRGACPVSRAYARLAEQSAYHMRQFHK